MIVPWYKLHKSPRTTDFPVRRTAFIDRLEVRRTGMSEPPRSDDRLAKKVNRLNATSKTSMAQETGQGQSDIETEKSNPQEEESLRAYREQAEKFESLSESALETESIPMGHRQTIRKYFESIRPSSEQVDQVKDKTK